MTGFNNIIIVLEIYLIILIFFFFFFEEKIINYYIYFLFFFLFYLILEMYIYINFFKERDVYFLFFNNTLLITNKVFVFVFILSVIFFLLISILVIETKKNRILNKEIFFFIFMIYFFCKLLIVSFDFINIYICLESISLLLCLLMKRNNILSIEASLKYFIYNGIVSVFFLLGLFNVIFYIGSFNLNDFCNFLIFFDREKASFSYYLSLFFIFFGFIYKLGMLPFHFWVLEIYQGVSLFFLMVLNSMPKIVLVYILSILLMCDNSFLSYLYFMILFSLIYSGIVGLSEYNLKRVLGVSSIYNISLSLTPLLINQLDLCFLNLILYILLFFNIILILLLINDYYRNIFNIYDLKNFYIIDNKLLMLFNINLFGLMGLPPIYNFFVKFEIFNKLIDEGFGFLVVVILITSIFSCFYYLNLIQKGYIVRFNDLNKLILNRKIKMNNSFIFYIYMFTFLIFYLQFNENGLLVIIYGLK